MEKNKDWEELEQWAENDKQRKIDTYKIDINNMNKNTNKVDKVIKFFTADDIRNEAINQN